MTAYAAMYAYLPLIEMVPKDTTEEQREIEQVVTANIKSQIRSITQGYFACNPNVFFYTKCSKYR